MDKNYSYDYVHNTDVYVHQRKDMFRINTDTALLANFMRIEEGDKILDIGTNNAALLLVAATFHPSYLYGAEIQHDAVKLANYNLKDCVIPFKILEGDVTKMALPIVDVIVCNPPYFKVSENSNVNESDYLKIARHECYLPFDRLCQVVASSLQQKGRFYLVHRADRIAELISIMHEHRLYVRTLQFVYDKNKEEAISVLVEAIKDGGHNVHVLEPITNDR